MGWTATLWRRRCLRQACAKVVTQVRALVEEYRLQPSSVDLIGGGGGAASLVPRAGALMGVPWRLARQAEVISPIGVALAMVRDTIERNIVDPTPADVLRVRQEAVEAAVRNGALAETVEVHVEVDSRRNLVRAVAVGTAELRRGGASGRATDEDGRRSVVARSMQRDSADVTLVATSGQLDVFTCEARAGAWWQPWRREAGQLRVVDRTGVVRLQRGDAVVRRCTVNDLEGDLRALVTSLVDFGDAGRHDPRRVRARRVAARQPVRPGRRGPDARPRRRRGPARTPRISPWSSSPHHGTCRHGSEIPAV